MTIGTSSESQQLVGTLAVFGVAARNRTLLIERYRRGSGRAQLGIGGRRLFAEHAISCRPILSAFIATAGALLPLAVLRPASAPSPSTGCPLVLAGLVTSILVNLFHLAVTPHPHRPDPEAEVVALSIRRVGLFWDECPLASGRG